ncbi:MAG: hypothetical protein R3C01_04670 [Planctomycetaceae bacterium]
MRTAHPAAVTQKFLLRQGRRFYTEGVSHWTKTHWSWIRRQTFDFEAQNQLLADAMRHEADQAQSRISPDSTPTSMTHWPDWRLGLVQNLQAFLVRVDGPSELSQRLATLKTIPDSGEVHVVCQQFQRSVERSNTSSGGIRKNGNLHVRRLLIEAAWR